MGGLRRFGLENNFQPRIKGMGDATKHAEGVAFVGRRFEPADLLLGGVEFAGEVLLGKTGPFPERRDLQSHVPRLPFQTARQRRGLSVVLPNTGQSWSFSYFTCSTVKSMRNQHQY